MISFLSHTLFLNLHDDCSKVYIICGLTNLRPLLHNWVISYISKKGHFREFSRATSYSFVRMIKCIPVPYYCLSICHYGFSGCTVGKHISLEIRMVACPSRHSSQFSGR